jgi:hypothetical protein
MNHLAHLFLADGTPGSIIGNLAGDFVKGSLAAFGADASPRGIVVPEPLATSAGTRGALGSVLRSERRG